jgi:hypothetical protein
VLIQKLCLVINNNEVKGVGDDGGDTYGSAGDEKAGARGLILAFVFGTIPTGPIYIAFPIAVKTLKLS